MKNFLPLILFSAALGACAQAESDPAPTSPAFSAADLEGRWTLRMTADTTSGATIRALPDPDAKPNASAAAVEPEAQEVEAAGATDFQLEVAQRDGRISGCTVDPAAGLPACAIEGERFVVRTGEAGQPALVFTIRREASGALAGEARMESDMLPTPTVVGTVVMTRRA